MKGVIHLKDDSRKTLLPCGRHYAYDGASERDCKECDRELKLQVEATVERAEAKADLRRIVYGDK